MDQIKSLVLKHSCGDLICLNEFEELLGKGQSLVEDMSVSQQAAVKGISNRL